MVCVSVLRVPIRFGSTWLMLAEFVSGNKFVSGSGLRRTIVLGELLSLLLSDYSVCCHSFVESGVFLVRCRLSVDDK